MAKSTTTNNDIETEEKTVKKHLEFFSWLQEFSKKVVTVTFLMFAVANIFYMIVMWVTFKQANLDILTYMDNFISLMHTTFRDVIGGYIIKAATENVIKIGGGYLETYMQYKLSTLKDKAKQEDPKCQNIPQDRR